MNGVSYQRQTMLFGNPEVSNKRHLMMSGVSVLTHCVRLRGQASNISEHLKTTANN